MSVLLECSFLTRRYGARAALRGFSCSLHTGEVVGLLGPNGAGKSTLLRILSGSDWQSEGEYFWQGTPNWDLRASWRRQLGYLAENNPLIPELTVQEHLEFCARIQGMERGQMRLRMEEMIATCHLQSVLHRPVFELSRGFRQRTGLACALLHDPELLLLDEPTTGLDPNEIAAILNMIRHLGQHKTVIHSTHILSEAEATCDRVWILQAGSLIADAAPSQLLTQAGGHAVILETPCPDLENALAALAGVRSLQHTPVQNGMRYTLHLETFDPDACRRIGAFCHQYGVEIHALHLQSPRLETVFSHLTGENA